MSRYPPFASCAGGAQQFDFFVQSLRAVLSARRSAERLNSYRDRSRQRPGYLLTKNNKMQNSRSSQRKDIGLERSRIFKTKLFARQSYR